AALSLGSYFTDAKSPGVAAPVVNVKPEAHAGTPDPLELKQRNALDSANKLIAINDLNGAQQTLQQDAALKGPLTSAMLRHQQEIEASMKDANLRQLRQTEEK